MRKYIDSEAFFKVINTLPYKDTSYPDASVYNGAISDVADMLTHFPAADVAEVRHGRWEHSWGDEWCCTVCAHIITTEGSWERPWQKYCEECGAKMDEVGDNG